MKLFQIVPQIFEFESFASFAESFGLCETDLLFTGAHTLQALNNTELPCITILRDNYGSGEPSDVMVNAILTEAAKHTFHRIIAVGGGAILDIAKIIAVANGCTDVNELYACADKLGTDKELIAVPTTCGTGSEITNISIVYRSAADTKQGLVSDAMYPRYAVLIPELLETMPYNVFATSSIDALIHAVESYLSPLATPYSEMYSIAAIREILQCYIETVSRQNDFRPSCPQLLKASNYAGIAFSNAGCGPVHAISYAFGGKYHVPHGESNYQFFLPVLSFYKKTAPDGKIRSLEQLLCEVTGNPDGFEGLKELLEKILPAKPMRAYGASEEDIEPFTESTAANQQRLLGRQYCKMGKEDIYNIYRSCL